MTVIVVSYNTRELTLKCLASVYEQTEETAFEIIVVDNASDDGSARAVGEAFPQAQLLAHDENLGFGAANNYAAKRAKGRYLLLLNPDTVVLDHAIDRLVGYARAREATGIVGGRTVFADGSLNPTSCWAKPTLWSALCEALCLTTLFPHHSLFDPEAMGRWKRNSERQVDIVTGCFLLIPKQLWDTLGGFNPTFFMYGEDFDLNLRASSLGHQALFTPAASIVHLGGASEPVKEEKLIRLLTAQCQLMRSHWSPMSALIGVRLKLVGAWLRARLGQASAVLGLTELAARSQPWLEVWRRRAEWR